MYGDGGPPGNQGKAPFAVWALRSFSSDAARSASAVFGSSTWTNPRPSSLPPFDSTSQGDSSSVIFRFGSTASHAGIGVSRFASSAAIFATAG